MKQQRGGVGGPLFVNSRFVLLCQMGLAVNFTQGTRDSIAETCRNKGGIAECQVEFISVAFDADLGESKRK